MALREGEQRLTSRREEGACAWAPAVAVGALHVPPVSASRQVLLCRERGADYGELTAGWLAVCPGAAEGQARVLLPGRGGPQDRGASRRGGQAEPPVAVSHKTSPKPTGLSLPMPEAALAVMGGGEGGRQEARSPPGPPVPGSMRDACEEVAAETDMAAVTRTCQLCLRSSSSEHGRWKQWVSLERKNLLQPSVRHQRLHARGDLPHTPRVSK